MTKTEIVIIGILAVWFMACICYAVFNKQMAKYTNRWDIFRLISAYQLFRGEQRQYRLFYRDQLSENDEAGWNEICLVPGYKWYHPVWFPEALAVQVIASAVDDLVTLVKAGENTPVMEHISERFIYQTILRFIRRFPAKSNSTARQFKIEESSGFIDGQKPLYVFVSPLHPI